VSIAVTVILVVVALTAFSNSGPTPGGGSPPATDGVIPAPATNADISIEPLSSAATIPSTFWGINVEPGRPFTSAGASALATTGVSYVRFPGGVAGDEMNYTSGNVTNKTGAITLAVTSLSDFVNSCNSIGCHAILELPAEIDSPSTAAYYVSYVENTLGFTPKYWEIGNEPSSWNHYDQPWSLWATDPTNSITVDQYLPLLANITAAVRAVDPVTPIIAPAIGQGGKTASTCSTWCEPVAAADGSLLAAMSVHSYVASPPSTDTSLDSYFSLLSSSYYAIPTAIPRDRAAISAGDPAGLPLFVDEAGVVNSFTGNETTFGGYTTQLYGGLFQAAEVTQFLAYDVVNVDWFDWSSSAGFGWYSSGSSPWSPIGQVFHTFMPLLYEGYDPTSVAGSSTLYAAATTDGSNLALLVVNVNTTTPASFPLSMLFSGPVSETSWNESGWADGLGPSTSSMGNTTAIAENLSVNVWRGPALLVAGGPAVSPTVIDYDNQQASTLSASVMGGTPPYTVEWYVDSVDTDVCGQGTSVVLGSGLTWTTGEEIVGAGAYHYCYVVTDSNGVTQPSAFATVTVDPTLTASPLATTNPVDVGDTTTISADASGGSGSYSSFVWSALPPGCGTPGNVPSFACTTDTGDLLRSPYSVEVVVTDSNGATSNHAFLLTVTADPTVSVTPDGPLTYDVGQPGGTLTATVTYDGTNGAPVAWYSSSTPACSTSATYTGTAGKTFPVSTASIRTRYYCAVVSDNGLPGYTSVSNVVEVTVGPALVAGTPSANPNPVVAGQPTTISTTPATGGSGSYTYSWSSGLSGCALGTGASFVCSPSVTITNPTPYNVTLTVQDSNGNTVTASLTLTVDPKPTSFSVTFAEFGLTAGLTWKVTLHGTAEHLRTNRTTDRMTDVLTWKNLASGTYAYSITGNAGWHQATLAYSGHVVVSGASVLEPSLNYTLVTYAVTFTETGLPTGTMWSVTVNGVRHSSVTPIITFVEANGTYSYKIGVVSGYAPAHSSGSVVVKGAAASVAVKFSRGG
jgi:hypothetical protein